MIAGPVAAFTVSPHGTRSRHNKGGCRCPLCREAHNRYMRERRVFLAAALAADPTIVEHATINAYSNYGCRCAPCVEFKARYARGES